MTQNERLRALLKEARDWMIDDTCHDCERGGCELRQRIDAALAEPPSPVERENASLDVMWQEMVRECDAARAEATRYRKTFDCIADGSVWNSKEAAEFVLGRKP